LKKDSTLSARQLVIEIPHQGAKKRAAEEGGSEAGDKEGKEGEVPTAPRALGLGLC